MDLDGNGTLGFEEISTALVGLGITSNRKFVQHVFKAATPTKFATEESYNTMTLNKNDFLRLF